MADYWRGWGGRLGTDHLHRRRLLLLQLDHGDQGGCRSCWKDCSQSEQHAGTACVSQVEWSWRPKRWKDNRKGKGNQRENWVSSIVGTKRCRHCPGSAVAVRSESDRPASVWASSAAPRVPAAIPASACCLHAFTSSAKRVSSAPPGNPDVHGHARTGSSVDAVGVCGAEDSYGREGREYTCAKEATRQDFVDPRFAGPKACVTSSSGCAAAVSTTTASAAIAAQSS